MRSIPRLVSLSALVFVTGCVAGTDGDSSGGAAPELVDSMSSAMVAVAPPSLSIPHVSYYCSATYPNAASALLESAAGDYNSNPCAGMGGAKVRRVGMMTSDDWNIAETRCDPNYYWISERWGGSTALAETSTAAEQTPTNGNCWSKVTIGPDLRANENAVGPIDEWSNTQNSYAVPGSYTHGPRTFHATQFFNRVRDRVSAFAPPALAGLVGFQVSLRSKLASNAPHPAPMGQGMIVDSAFGKVAGGQFSLPEGSAPDIGNPNMTVTRRFDSASTAKTITAVAAVAAFEDIEQNGNPLKISLESKIKPHLNAIGWTVHSSLANLTFRDLLRHTTPLCRNGRQNFDDNRYSGLKAMMAHSPASADPPWQPTTGFAGIYDYCNHNYALMRILIAILVEGPRAFKNANGTLRSDAERDRISAISYRNFVRGKLFAPIGLTDVDVFYKGPLPETIYFRDNGAAIPDRLNVGYWWDTNGYDQRANTTMLSAGAGFWFLSAQEWTLFLANLWAGRIVSQASLSKLLTPYSLGMDLGTDIESGQPTWGHNGGGGHGGPWTQWVTFPDGASAVIQSNAPTGDADFRAILEYEYATAWY